MSDSIVAKMYLSEVTRGQYQSSDATVYERVKLQAVSGSKGTVNASWSQATPSGSLELQINNPDAIGKLKPGYYKIQIVPCGVDD